MSKTGQEQAFDLLVSKQIWPHFKKTGYKKSGNNFRFYDVSGWGKVVNFQKSMYGNKNHISFTVNTGLYLAESEQFHCNRQSGEKFSESMCMVRRRIGYLSNDKKDLWFDINEETDTAALNEIIENYFHTYIIPYLEKIKSKENILKFLVEGHNSGYPIAQIKTLHFNGLKNSANQFLQKELRRPINPIYLQN